MTNYDKLITVLEEVFQLNQAELDFGIYRILNQKREEITDFLRNKLIPQVKAIIAQSSVGNVAQIKKELEEAIAQARALGADPDALPRVKDLKAAYGAAPEPEALEEEIFSHLAAFFKRYYKEGDFISMRRYKKDVYAIPYEGEEVKLYWANHDQYYIKTSEHLKNYAFKLRDGRKVRFELLEATTEKDNRKEEAGKERRFRIYKERPLEANGDVLSIFFTYDTDDKKTKQDKLNEAAAQAIKTHLPSGWVAELLQKMPTEKDKSRTLLDKHLKDFTARNTFDYFIHKDLHGFLSRELDFYIKNEVLHLDDVNPEAPADFRKQLLKVQAIREIGGKIITFLAQLEDFQRKLWLKKKFVIDTQYCITLDRIPEAFYPEIAANEAQRQEWVRLFAIDELKADLTQPGYSEPLSLDFLKAQPYLVLDTAFFAEDFKLRLIAAFDDLDASLDGLLINSENFQALNLLQERYREEVNSIYIDPPYNTAATEIIYKNSYKHSSWLSLIEGRLNVSKTLMKESSIICVTIDDAEVSNLDILLKEVFSSNNYLATTPIRSKPQGRASSSGFSTNHEYALYFGKTYSAKVGRLPREGAKLERYSEKDDLGIFAWSNFRKTGGDSTIDDRPRSYYPIYVSVDTGEIRIPPCEWNTEKTAWNVLEKAEQNEKEIFPLDSDGNRRVWTLSRERAETVLNVDLIAKQDYNQNWQVYRKYRPNQEGTLPGTWWDNSKYSASESGTKVLQELFGDKYFSFPKSIHAVQDSLLAMNLGKEGKKIALDYFAGSGTTAHAVINLNREDGGNRRYILVEMGQYFDTVTKPRVQKVIYSAEWKNGKPVGRQGSSHAFKYLRLEGYEDTLNNLELRRQRDQQQLLGLNDRFEEAYMLSYLLDVESEGSLLNVSSFEDPFDYKLNIIKDNEQVPTKVDLVETFNYLIGLKVKTSERIRGFHVVTGENLAGERILVIWRKPSEKSNADLDAFFKKQQYNARDQEFDRIYVNGDNNVENLKLGDEKWKVVLIEEAFLQAMFSEQQL